jgi:hypothetical protein
MADRLENVNYENDSVICTANVDIHGVVLQLYNVGTAAGA